MGAVRPRGLNLRFEVFDEVGVGSTAVVVAVLILVVVVEVTVDAEVTGPVGMVDTAEVTGLVATVGVEVGAVVLPWE